MKRKNQRWRRICAWALALVMAVSPFSSAQILAATKAADDLEEYREGVCERYEEYRDSINNWDYLTNDMQFRCSRWAQEVDYITTEVGYKPKNADEKNFFEKFGEVSNNLDHNYIAEISPAVLWAGHTLTDTKLDREAYVEYLSHIVSMHEKGLLETAEAQAEYTARVNIGKEVAGIFGEGFELFLNNTSAESLAHYQNIVDAETIKKLEDGLKSFIDVAKIGIALKEEAENAQDAYSVALYSSLHKDKTAFLQAICDSADQKENKKLIKAASTLIDASDMNFAGLLLTDSSKRLENFVTIETKAAGLPGLDDCVEEMSQIACAAGINLINAEAGEGWEFLTAGLKFLGSNVSLISAGVKIGGKLGKIFMGNAYERFREMLIMDETAGVLSDAVVKYDEEYSAARKKGDTEKCYTALTNLVASAEALCYVRLRGEYLACEYAKSKLFAPSDEELEQRYENSAEMLARCQTALNEIFPERPAQVVVYGERDYQTEICGTWPLTTDIATPVIYIEGNEEASQKIMNSQALLEAQESIRESAAAMRDWTKEASESGIMEEGGSSASLCLQGAGVTKQSVSLMMLMRVFDALAVHPMYGIICCNFDTETGDYLKLEDILVQDESGDITESKNALGLVLAQAFQENEKGQAILETSSSSASEIVDTAFLNTDETTREMHWYLSQDGFHMMFAPYQIASYAAGVVDIIAPWESLKDIIQSKYQPYSFEDKAAQGIPVLERKDEVSISVPEDEMNLYGTASRAFWIGYTDETAYDVEIESGLFGSQLMFYANYMTPDDVVCFNDADDEYSTPTDGGIVSCLARPGGETKTQRVMVEYGNAKEY